MSALPLLRCTGLSASYGNRTVFGSTELSLPPGCYALEGANGSGKSTLLGLLAGARAPDRGEVWIDGLSLADAPEAARRRLSYVPDQSPIYPFMTGRELLRFVATAKGVAPSDAARDEVELIGVAAHLDSRFDAISFGTQKKLLLCAAWIGDPRVMLLDEPSNGLDHAARDVLAARLRAAAAEHRTVLFAAHDADFVTATGAAILSMASIAGAAT